jgi:arginase
MPYLADPRAWQTRAMPPTLALVGIAFDGQSSSERGAALAPAAIRAAFHSAASNLWTETGVDLGSSEVWVDVGDVAPDQGRETFEAHSVIDTIDATITSLLARGLAPLVLGGDHSITFPILRAMARHHPPLTLVQFDAHPDLYEDYEGNRFSHACQFARILEAGLAKRLVQIGIRTMNEHQRMQAERFGVEVITMREIERASSLALDGPIYVSFDLDGLDPAYAPGVSHPEAGGLTTRQALNILHHLFLSKASSAAASPPRLVGADVVELNPRRDVSGLTALVGAKVLKELLGLMFLKP